MIVFVLLKFFNGYSQSPCFLESRDVRMIDRFIMRTMSEADRVSVRRILQKMKTIHIILLKKCNGCGAFAEKNISPPFGGVATKILTLFSFLSFS